MRKESSLKRLLPIGVPPLMNISKIYLDTGIYRYRWCTDTDTNTDTEQIMAIVIPVCIFSQNLMLRSLALPPLC